MFSHLHPYERRYIQYQQSTDIRNYYVNLITARQDFVVWSSMETWIIWRSYSRSMTQRQFPTIQKHSLAIFETICVGFIFFLSSAVRPQRQTTTISILRMTSIQFIQKYEISSILNICSGQSFNYFEFPTIQNDWNKMIFLGSAINSSISFRPLRLKKWCVELTMYMHVHS